MEILMKNRVTILPETTRYPITLIGERAGVCWGADISDLEKNYKRGLDCLKSNHGRTLEFVNVEMVIDGYSARVIREWYTHLGGSPTRLQASTRYIEYGDFQYITPESVYAQLDTADIYHDAMRFIQDSIKKLEEMGVPREDCAMLLPLGMTTRIVDKRNLRNLIDMSHQRMCNRAYWEFRELFTEICTRLSEYSDEWKYIIENYMKPKCEILRYCPEKNGCGRMWNEDGEGKVP